MTRIQKIGKMILPVLILTGLASCLGDDNEAPFTMIAEVATVKRMVNEDVVYARMYYAYGTQPMSSVQVSLPEGGSFTLTNSDASAQTWYKEPTLSDFSATPPETGEYVFTVVNEDIEHKFSDLLEMKTLGFTEISAITAGNASVTVEWETLSQSESYKILLKTDQNELVYASPLLMAAANKFTINASSGLTKDLEVGANYTIELLAYVYEDTATAENDLFNIEAISITSQEVIMGE